MTLLWIVFSVVIIILLALDLGVFHKRDSEISAPEAIRWTLFWILLALAFNAVIYWTLGREPAVQYLTGYLIEKSLSLDNLFVISAIFAYMGTPRRQQHRILFWGILGAIILRGAFILAGAELLHRFSWINMVFGGILIYGGIRTFGKEKEPGDLKNNLIIKFASIFRASPFITTILIIELSDLIFAVDSIPAIFSITQDPFIVFTSNIMAILGLRSLYFALDVVLRKFEKMKYSIGFILFFVGLKMILAPFFSISSLASLAIVFLALICGFFAS